MDAVFLLHDGRVVTSASDVTMASTCEFAFLRTLDTRLGRIPPIDETVDELQQRTSQLGDAHEQHVLEDYRREFGCGVVELPRPVTMTADALLALAAQTTAAFGGSEATVVYQATFFDERSEPRFPFVGFADFVVRVDGACADGAWQVQDTKLARHAKVTALLQVAAYAQQLRRDGLPVAETVQLLLGDGTVSEHPLDEIEPVFRIRRSRLHALVQRGCDATAPVRWSDDGFMRCGRCALCEAEVVASRDVLLVAGMRVGTRARLAAAGVHTIDDLATASGSVDGVSGAALAGMRGQAALQVRAMAAAEATRSPTAEPLVPPVEVVDPAALAVLPEPDEGDLFFDFEGDPLWHGDEEWGLDYLFGTLAVDESFTPFWAHDSASERDALRDFLAFVSERRRRHPGLHIYHYAAYERTHLASLAARHGIGEDEVDRLLREHVLVDLYPIVRRALRVGSRSYSIKKLEPLYMGDLLRDGDVQNAAASITEYARAVDLRAAGQGDEADAILAQIADYNRYDCLSTLRLRDWLLGLATRHGVPVGAGALAEHPELLEAAETGPPALQTALLRRAGDGGPARRTDDETAAAMAAAALDYHAREQKSFWWGHFSRLIESIDEWEDTRDVLRVTDARLERSWHRQGRQRSDRRRLVLRGRAAPGSRFSASGSSGPYLLYEFPGPYTVPGAEPGARTARQVTIVEVAADGAFLVDESLPAGVEPFDELPSALTPAPPPRPGRQPDAIEEWAKGIVDAEPGWPRDAMTDLLRRIPPRMISGGGVPSHRPDGGERIDAVTAAVLDLDDSYLAVQGPPGTGKTYLAAHVIARLVRDHRWRVGVVAQSHAVVENLLDAIVTTAGLPSESVGKVPQRGVEHREASFTVVKEAGHAAFLREHDQAGCVIGGTAWDFSNDDRVPRGALDLLVVDEAGQFSLASTIASAVSAHNLLLLGDPQQLPQVSQGAHPEPVDGSALGWVSSGHEVLPAEFGIFLAETRRMHPALAERVSRLSYGGRLRAHPTALLRELEGVAPGLHPTPVVHESNSVESAEEADEVVRIVQRMLGRAWHESGGAREPGEGRQLAEADIIVVTAYNAQQALVRERLAAAGHPGVRVGTVDKFQGQEAVVAIVSLAASSAADVPRGLSFLLMKNRLNVAVSRAKWAAFLVYSPALGDHLPATPAGLAELSAFLRLVESDGDR